MMALNLFTNNDNIQYKKLNFINKSIYKKSKVKIMDTDIRHYYDKTHIDTKLKKTIKTLDNENEKMRSNIHDLYGVDKLPEGIEISTMTVCCKFPTLFNVGNIAQYIDLDSNGIIGIKFGNADNPHTNRSLIVKSKISIAKNKKKRSFFNQVTLQVRTKKIDKIVNVKIFLNGSIQMTGCKGIENALEAIDKILTELKTIRGVFDFENKKIIDKPFAQHLDKLEIKYMYDFGISMINTNFNIGFKINRDKLHNLLMSKGMDATYDPNIHACVSIKYEHSEKQLAIFAFESGAIIITGVRNYDQIMSAYIFINKFLLKNYNAVVKHDALDNETILRYLHDIEG